MAKVLITTTATAKSPFRPFARRDFERLTRAAPNDNFHVHQTTNDPDEADIILFVGSSEPDFRDVRRHPWVKSYRNKCFHFDAGDRIIPFLPGVYASIEKRWYLPQRTRSGFYPRVFENQKIVFDDKFSDATLLFSFLGSIKNSPVRGRLVELHYPRGMVKDTSEVGTLLLENCPENADAATRYSHLLRKSKFILCPRGQGASSWRLFETMKAGRAPVIISDQWVPPQGPDWESFSLRVTERDIPSLPFILESYEDRAQSMGVLARKTWEEWFSEPVAFHRITEWCLDIYNSRTIPETLARLSVYAQLLRPKHFRYTLLGTMKRRMLQDYSMAPKEK